jgi:hypothetical protein
LIYSAVRALNPRATSILTSGAGPIAYDNMATFGFMVPNGAAGVSLDAVGQTGTTQGGQVVLLTMEAGNATSAVVRTDRADYSPGDVVTITGSGWDSGETVKLSLHMDPLRDADTELTAIADGNGTFSNTDFSPSQYDINVRFVLTAVGQTSGRRSQTTFTDGPRIDTVTVTTQTGTPVYGTGGTATYTVTPIRGNNGTVNGTLSIVSGLPTGVTAAFTPSASFSANGGNAFPSRTLTLTTSALTPSGTFTFTLLAADGTDQEETTGTLTIDKRSLTVSATATSKTYDATANATVTLSDNAVNGDVITKTFTSATFANKNVGNAKTVTVNGISISGTAAANYTLASTTATTTANITTRSITVTAVADTKQYDGTTTSAQTPTVTTGTIVGGDTPNFTQAFATKTVGTAKTINASGTVNDGNAGANYAVTFQSVNTGEITAKALTGAITANNKVYNGTDAAVATGQPLTGVISPDVVTLVVGAATFDNKNVGTGKTVTAPLSLSGVDAGNYTVNALATALANITPKSLTGTITAANKVYDRLTTAVATGQPLSGVITPDVVTLIVGAANFDTKDVGTGKTVTAALSLGGGDASNYSVNATATAVADITARTLTVSATGQNKVYDGTTTAIVTLADDHITGDVVNTSYATATFDNKNVGTGKNISVTGITIGGADASNYIANTTCTASADITAKSVTGSFTANNKIYDGTTGAVIATRTLSGTISGDDVSLTGGTATFANKNVGTNKTVNGTGFVLSGADAPNYSLASSSLVTTADITARALTISAAGVNRVYDATTAATVTLSDDRVSGDVFTDSYTSASFGDKNVGTAKLVAVSGISISGTDAGNYTFNTTANTTADITARALTVSATGVNKVYDGTTNATVTLSDNRVSGDVFTTAYTTAAFTDKNVGTGKTVNVSGISITGTDAGNYTFNTTANTTANITARALAVTATGVNKVYDGTTAATVTFSDDRIAGDAFTVSGSASFADKNVGTGKTVTVTGISLSGADAGNYTPNASTTTTADITARALTITATGVNKVYDATTAATVALSDDRIAGDVFTDTYTTATFADKNVGTGKAISVTGISISGADAGNYTFNSSAAATANITAKALAVTATAQDKTYDGTDAATVSIADDRISGDVFTVNYTTAKFSDKNVGTGKTVTVSGITLSGTDAGNYAPNATAVTTASITQRALTITATGQNKVYDGTTAATVTLADDRVTGDVFTVNYTAAFADKNVGNAKPISVTGISISGTDAGNYTFNTTASTTADITQKSITGNFTADNKAYDGNTSATVLTRSLSGAIAGDDVSLTGGTGTFDTKHVGTSKTVTLTGAVLSGTDAGNYLLSSVATATANITPKALTITASGVNKVYDGTAAATVTLADDRVSGDVFTDSYTSATFNNKNVGSAKPISVTGISISGADAGNYTFNTTAPASADITPRALTVSATGINKVYDGTTAATVTLSDDRVVGDVLSTAFASATFSDKNVGNGKTVTVTGISVTGADAGNYTFNTSTTTTADITARPLVISATGVNKVYDGTATATVTLSDDRVAGDVFTSSYAGASFNNKNVGAGKPVSVTGISISGTDAGNYTFNTTASTTADITARALTITATGVNKVYDATAAATVTLSDDRVAGDVFTDSYASATFNDKNVATAKPVSVSGISISGTDAGNYTFNTTASTTADITQKSITGSFTADNKVYDGNTNATVLTRSLSGNIAGDDVSLTGGTATFANKNVGTGKTVTLSGGALSGVDAGNYFLSSVATTTADITARALTIAATGINKVYDGTTAATVTLSDNRVAGDGLTTAYASASFADKNVGTGKAVSVSGISLGGSDAGNYTFNSSASTTADITARTLTVTATGVNKVYDGNAIATVTLSDDRVAGDVFTDAYTLATFNNKNVGTAKPVSVSGILISGTDALNYAFNTTASTTADITARPLTVTATGVNKVYDGTTAATVTFTDNRVSGDVFTVSGSASFADKNVGTGKTVSVSGIALSGTDANNYTHNTTATTSADITTRALTVSAAGIDKVYDATTAATVTLSDDRVAGDVLTTAYASATFDNKNVGPAKTVNVTGITISGADAGNYTFNTNTTTTAAITPLALVVSATGVDKVYNGNTAASVTLSDNRLSGDAVTTSYSAAAFNNKNVGNGKPVSVSGISISGPDAGNYSFNTTASTSANITPRGLNVSATAANKVYDATTTAVATLSDDRVAGDALTTSYTNANFNNENVGNTKPVSVTGIAVGGADAGNYTFNPSTITAANITARLLTVTADDKSKIAGAVNPPLTGTIAGVQGADGITATFTTLATTGSLPGSYTITSGTNDPNAKIGNYAVTLNNGTLTVTANAKPVLGTFTGPTLPVPLGTSISISVPFTDIDVAASTPYTATIDWGNGTTTVTHPAAPGTISDVKTYPTAGVYTVKVTVSQDNFPLTHLDTKTYEYYVVVYDPNGGFVTGGGWINSPAGAYYADPSLTGKANFGFVSKYKKGQSTPDGNTEFQYQAGNLNFKATAFDWLVIAGAKAQFKGLGTINGTGNYGFMLTAIDGQTTGGGGTDKFRMKIWIKNANGTDGPVVYDNQLGAADDSTPTTVLGGGSIQIHDK